MKTIIYYYSKSGHSKNYAESLANRIVCESFNYKKMKYRHLKDFDTIIFVAPVYANKIRKVNKFLKLYKKIKNKNLIIVAVGMQPPSEDRRRTIITVNLLDDYHIRLYELIGGFDANKLSWPLRKLMKFGLKMAIKKDPLLQSQAAMVGTIFDAPREYNDISGIERIMDTIHRLEQASKVI
ncbi:MAG: flavodoxin domain-containing protein [Bacilli bacterium]|nr:flavodoxin domain-containing protein [Bacilli bacterium]